MRPQVTGHSPRFGKGRSPTIRPAIRCSSCGFEARKTGVQTEITYNFKSPPSTSPTIFKTSASSKARKAGSPVPEKAIAPQWGSVAARAFGHANGLAQG